MDKEQFVVTTEEVTAYLAKCEQLHERFHDSLSEVEDLQEILELNWSLATGLIEAYEELKHGPETKH